ncbi:ribonuclease E inhibitor RraB [Chitinibacter bivalviorum]|uniref:Ribonuclease E inhibitor RraB n=1 Tax=Chitinibacter bivalviorum TaxID=2739434 RepID=A0A7H9BFT8_9NEIS|nr:ribonuclease E inhibitor RraB [Chitinibacter bivalviorum]QLG87106.1 ribonuclease E inhibitor RraB [Chitinibacter bivalviorum]
MITLEQMEEMFASIRENTDWDLAQPLVWGYFFTDKSDEKLASVIPLLEAQGYRFVDLFIPQLDEGVEEYLVLHVEKEEIHTPQSLFERNQQFYDFVSEQQLLSYDGMDVGPLGE